MSQISRATETVTLTKNQLEAILELISQFGAISVSNEIRGSNGRKSGLNGSRSPQVESREDQSPMMGTPLASSSVAYVEPMRSINSETGCQTRCFKQFHSDGRPCNSGFLNSPDPSGIHGKPATDLSERPSKDGGHLQTIHTNDFGNFGHLTDRSIEFHQNNPNQVASMSLSTPVTPFLSRKQFPNNLQSILDQSNQGISESRTSLSSSAHQMNSSSNAYSATPGNSNSNPRSINQSELLQSMPTSMSYNSLAVNKVNHFSDQNSRTFSSFNSPPQSFRRCNRITGDTESSEWEVRRHKMMEYQAMLDEQRMEKEKRIKLEKEKLAREEEALERRLLEQQERMRREFEEEQKRLIERQEVAERKRLAVAQAIERTPVIRRRNKNPSQFNSRRALDTLSLYDGIFLEEEERLINSGGRVEQGREINPSQMRRTSSMQDVISGQEIIQGKFPSGNKFENVKNVKRISTSDSSSSSFITQINAAAASALKSEANSRRDMSVQTDYNLLFEWLADLKNKQKIDNLFLGRGFQLDVMNSVNKRTKSVSPVPETSHARRSRQPKIKARMPIKPETRSPIKQTRSKWYRDPNLVTWKPVGDVITSSEFTTKGLRGRRCNSEMRTGNRHYFKADQKPVLDGSIPRK